MSSTSLPGRSRAGMRISSADEGGPQLPIRTVNPTPGLPTRRKSSVAARGLPAAASVTSSANLLPSPVSTGGLRNWFAHLKLALSAPRDRLDGHAVIDDQERVVGVRRAVQRRLEHHPQLADIADAARLLQPRAARTPAAIAAERLDQLKIR